MFKMGRITLLVLFLVLCIHLYEAKDLVVGTRVNNLLISTEKVVYGAIPLFKRDKDYTYKDPKRRIIKFDEGVGKIVFVVVDNKIKGQIITGDLRKKFGIIARDLSRTEAEVTVTEGGVGADHVTLHLQSARGVGLNYLVLIFSNNP